jgi:hypothetical protein
VSCLIAYRHTLPNSIILKTTTFKPAPAQKTRNQMAKICRVYPVCVQAQAITSARLSISQGQSHWSQNQTGRPTSASPIQCGHSNIRTASDKPSVSGPLSIFRASRNRQRERERRKSSAADDVRHEQHHGLHTSSTRDVSQVFDPIVRPAQIAQQTFNGRFGINIALSILITNEMEVSPEVAWQDLSFCGRIQSPMVADFSMHLLLISVMMASTKAQGSTMMGITTVRNIFRFLRGRPSFQGLTER